MSEGFFSTWAFELDLALMIMMGDQRYDSEYCSQIS